MRNVLGDLVRGIVWMLLAGLMRWQRYNAERDRAKRHRREEAERGIDLEIEELGGEGGEETEEVVAIYNAKLWERHVDTV